MTTWPGFRLRAVALPVEHGAWGFVLEPTVLGLAVAPSVGGVCFSSAVVASFLLRHPLKLFMAGQEPLSRSGRRRLAAAFSLVYAGVSVAGLVLGIVSAGISPLWALIVASPAVALFLFYDTRRRSRGLVPELAGPIGLAGVAPAIAIAGGWDWGTAWVLWVLMTARVVPSVLYVRARLRLGRGETVSRSGVVASHVVSIGVVASLAVVDVAPILSVGALGVLAIRAVYGVTRKIVRMRATSLGVAEVLYGLLYVSATVVGYRWGT